MSFRFANPWLLLLLLALPLLAAWPYLFKKVFKPAGLRFSDNNLAAGLPRSPRIWLQPVLPLFNLAIMGLLILAAARPQSMDQREVIKGEGVDIALALDISGSMASLDFDPQNRLQAAKDVIGDFIEERPYDPIGLVVFASTAFHQSPPTSDHEVLSRLLDEVELSSDLNIESGTAIGMGLANAANMLKDLDGTSKVIILLTDGVNNSGQIDPLTAADAAATLGIKVYTIGMGRSGQVPVPYTDAFGRQRITYQESDLDEETLQEIADKTGGLYYRAEDRQGLQQIYDEINQLEKSEYEIQRFTRYEELAGWLILPALLILIFEMVLRRTLFRTIP